jgi:Family of unknown function (DUF5996)
MAWLWSEDVWPALPYAASRPTLETLQLWTQIVGKVRLAQTPWLNHSWHVTLAVSARGLTTGLIPHGARGFELELDLISHELAIRVSDGGQDWIALAPGTIADFYAQVRETLERLGVPVEIDSHPNEMPDPIPFPQDTGWRAYDRELAHRFWHALLQADRVFKRFRTRFLGKCSPVHFFWGSFDLAVTRFSGRPAPLHPGGLPHLPDTVTREAYSHEVSSAGFWPGSGHVEHAAFYSYCYPMPPTFAKAPILPAEARFDPRFGEFLLPYEAVRTASDPDAVLLSFLQTTYEAAANTGVWDRAALETEEGGIGWPRRVG